MEASCWVCLGLFVDDPQVVVVTSRRESRETKKKTKMFSVSLDCFEFVLTIV